MPFDNSYGRLDEKFYQRINPTPVKAPRLILVNRELAGKMEFPLPKTDPELAQLFSGNKPPQGSDPLAQVYAGHQFGNFVPRLGDGRAVLLGEFLNSHGQRFDIQLKGAGQTMYSRNGDGRSPLGPVIREYIVSEAMFRLGIPTTRALAMVSSGEDVFREEKLPGAIFTRVASSHLRIGNFEYFAARNDHEGVKTLADYAIDRHYPELKETSNPYTAFLSRVCSVQARLVAKWMRVGFIHGVMNTDNTTISGETIDYGPCAFMDGYDPATVFSSIDHYGRYAYARQPSIAQWNLAGLGGCLLPLIHKDPETARTRAEEIVQGFGAKFRNHYFSEMCNKIGLSPEERSQELLDNFLQIIQESKADFTLSFRMLSKAILGETNPLLELFSDQAKIANWLEKWKEELARQNINTDDASRTMDRNNPAFIPRNHRVEQAITAAVKEDDFEPTKKLIKILHHPYKEQTKYAEYMNPPESTERVYQTFCGT
ncbi:YdiU family protein [Desulfovibrio sp. JC022]|uniref:protein adenylyltransferase SelO n=1 Tax=Desulfovibrio sp. JC022 TaxID=2593642 RepID=UPI0013D08B87|nr:YdiU family protein [Desulfovibrio sp. JC022]NDV22911.1 YdiU family protein [Desulfovibrio sp. JC022]